MSVEKHKIELEFELNTSLTSITNAVTTPSGLSEWFCDDVNINRDIYTFIWNNEEESALLLKKTATSFKLQWLDDEGSNYYFQFKYKLSELTKSIILNITDFAEEDEIEETKELWENQIADLKNSIGG